MSTDLAALWQALLERQLFVADSYCANGRCYAVIERAAGGPPPRKSGLYFLERVFSGESQKSLAYELDVSIAKIAAHSACALRAIGRPQQVSRAPIILVMAALAAHHVSLQPARLEDVHDDGRWIISVEVPGATLRRHLSPGEWEVARLLIEDETHASIATLRGTSRRTVANQLASIFQKLGISGRGMLRARAVHEAAIPATPQARWPEERMAAFA